MLGQSQLHCTGENDAFKVDRDFRVEKLKILLEIQTSFIDTTISLKIMEEQLLLDKILGLLYEVSTRAGTLLICSPHPEGNGEPNPIDRSW